MKAFAPDEAAPAWRRHKLTTVSPERQAAADAVWAEVVADLNSRPPSTQMPITGAASGPRGGASSTAAGKPSATVDWGSIARELNSRGGTQNAAATCSLIGKS